MTEKMKDEVQNEAIAYEGFLNEEIERVANTLKPFIEYAKNEGLDYTTAIYMATSKMEVVYKELICDKILNGSEVFSVLTGAMVKIAYEKALKEMLKIFRKEDKIMDFKQASEIRYNIQPVEPFAMPMVYTKNITQQGNNGVIAQGTYKGLNYYVKNMEGRHPTAYIELSQKFKLYNDAYELEEYEGKVSIECHGGVTYVSQTLRGVDNDGERNHRFVGWDYGHCTDFSGSYIGDERFSGKKKWTTEEIIEECKEVIDQILKLEDK